MKMKIAPYLAAVLVSSTLGQASQILVGTDNSGNGDLFVGNQSSLANSGGVITSSHANLGVAQAFTLTDEAIASDISVWVKYDNVPSTFDLQLTDSLGPGTTGSNVLFSGEGTYGAAAGWVDLEIGSLDLTPGTYYVVMTSDTPVPTPSLDGSDCGGTPAPGGFKLCYLAGEWGSNGTSQGVDGSLDSSYDAFAPGPDSPALTAFNLSNPNSFGEVEFQLNGDLASSPEPETMGLVGLGMAILLLTQKGKTARLSK